jgi:hypothetical protein
VRSRLPLLLLLASALVVLASLFMPWRAMHSNLIGPLKVFSDSPGDIDGWVRGIGDATVLVALAVVCATIAALVRPQLAAKLPLGGLGVALGYFTVAVVLQAHADSAFLQSIRTGPGGFTGTPARIEVHASWAYGFYLGCAGGAVAVLCSLGLRRRELLLRRPVPDLVAEILGIGLLASFLLPWVERRTGLTHDVGLPGIASSAAAVAALGVLLGAGWLLGSGRQFRLPFAVAIAVLTGGAASALALLTTGGFGRWIGVGLAVALVVVETFVTRPLRLPALPAPRIALRTGAALLLLVALFLPWQELRILPAHPETNGWAIYFGAFAGSLAVLLVVAAVLPMLEAYAGRAVVVIAFLVAALGAVPFEEDAVRFYRLGYGSFVGFAATGLLLLTVIPPLPTPRLGRDRVLMRAVAVTASVACLAAVVLPWWNVLPQTWSAEDTAVSSWVSIPAVFLALYLVRTWTRQMGRPTPTRHGLTLAPLVLLTLPALELIRGRGSQLSWAGVILVCLCVLLALLGWIEESRGGFESVRIPAEIWRVDRLPETES